MSSINSTKSSLWSDVASKFSLHRLRRTRKDSAVSRKSSSYVPYQVHHQSMFPAILRHPDATAKLLDAIAELPNGRRSLSRLSRTCKAFKEPCLNVLWRELDSLIPLIGLFPPKLLRKSKRPGLGLVKTPAEEDWKKLLAYGERVRRITYNEAANNVSASIFPIFQENKPQTYILPHLHELTWRAETSAGLDRCCLFLNPELQTLVLEIGTKLPQLGSFLMDMSSRTRLTTFSFSSPTSLPDDFTDLILLQDKLEKVVLVAPGALSPGVGRWAASLPKLQSLQLDLTGRSVIAVEGFFDNIRPRSGDSTPSSVGSTDSGVFSGEEVDFSEIRKSALRLTGDFQSKGSFPQLQQVHLTGDASNITVFLKHLRSSLKRLDLVMDDPPDKADWQDLTMLISERFGASLQCLRISATSASRFTELVRSTARAEPPSKHLSLQNFTSMPYLVRLEIDLPESVIFDNSDISHLGHTCPNVAILRLCPVSRFPISSGPPRLTLDGIASLVSQCRRLHTLALVINATKGKDEILSSPLSSSRSLLRLHVGHSWVKDPLQVAIILSHLTPYLENLKWFHERNRPGFVEANSRGWEKVSDYLPHLQNVRLVERAQVRSQLVLAAPAKPLYVPLPEPPKITKVDSSVQCAPTVISRMVEAKPGMLSKSVNASMATVDSEVQTSTPTSHRSVEARPLSISTAVGTVVPTSSQSVDSVSAAMHNPTILQEIPPDYASAYAMPSMSDMFSFAFAFCVAYPMYIMTYPLKIPYRVLNLTLSTLHAKREDSQEKNETGSEKLEPSSPVSSRSSGSTEYVISPDKVIVESEAPATLSEIAPFGRYSDCAGVTLAATSFLYKPGKVTAEIIAHRLTTAFGRSAVSLDETRMLRKLVKATQIWKAHHARIQALVNNTRPPTQTMSDSKKQEQDFTPEVDALLLEASSLVQTDKLQDGLDKLFVLEKQTRNASDLSSTTRLVKAILEHCYNARDYTLLNSSVTILSKKHGQLKGVVQAIVEQTTGWLEEIKTRDGVEKWLELIETLRGVTEGKIFLETPRARVTLLLANYHESLCQSTASSSTSQTEKESLQTASDLLSDLQVETYSSMARREKTEFILEQMRLLIAVARQKDGELGRDEKDSLGGGEAEWVKVRVGGRKINEEFLKEKDNEDLKLKYYELMIQHALKQTSYLDVAKYYEKVWETPSIQEDEVDKGKAALEHIVYYIVLAPHNNTQSDMLHHYFVNPALAKLELQYNLVKCFVTRELMRWPGIETIYGPFLRTTPVFSSDKRWEDLHTRVIEHNVGVVAQYYTRITLPRLTSLLDLTPQQTEDTLARLVVSGTVWARIDRPAGIVNFRSKRSAEDVMNDWSSDMQKLLGLVEKTWMGMNAAQAAQSRVKA